MWPDIEHWWWTLPVWARVLTLPAYLGCVILAAMLETLMGRVR